MRHFTLIFLSIICCAVTNSLAQAQLISGYVMDSSTHETIIGARLTDGTSGTQTNNFGRFSFKTDGKATALIIQYVGYVTKYVEIPKVRQNEIIVYIRKNELKEVIIRNKINKVDEKFTSITSIPMQQLKSVPAVGGEADIMKAIQHTPGIQGGVEGSAGVYVRGGSPDQNLILLDDVPVYNINHLFGYVSVFTPEAVKNFDIYKAGFPARYGGRLSSVMDVRMKEGNMKHVNSAITISPIASSFLLEGPLVKDKSSFLISARRTWLDGIAYLISQNKIKKAGAKSGGISLNFYDITMKGNYKFNTKNRLYFSFYSGNDKYGAKLNNSRETDSVNLESKNKQFLKWGNITTSLRYNKIFGQKLFSNATLAYTQYKFQTGSSVENTLITKNPYEIESNNASMNYISTIKDVIFKYDLEYLVSNKNTIRFGINSSFKQFLPGVYISGQTSTTKIDTTLSNKLYSNKQYDYYVEDNFSPTESINLNVGLRYERFNTNQFRNNNLQPRVNLSIKLKHDFAIKASYASMAQNIHLLSNSGAGLPTDLWLPATATAPTERSKQYVVGIYKNVKNQIDISVEAYQKKMYNVIEYKEGASFLGTFSGWENQITVGNGNVQGVEFFLHKKEGKLNGWIGYTLAYNNRSFPNLNGGKTFPYRYDRRHVFDIFANYQILESESKNRFFSVVWQYSTGNSITLPTQLYISHPNEPPVQYNSFSNILDGFGSQYYSSPGILNSPSRNNYRMRSQHRLDISYSSTKKKEWGERTWNFTIYNVYARQNPFYVYIYKPIGGENEKYVERSLFSIFPSIAYTIKFDAKKFLHRNQESEKYYE